MQLSLSQVSFPIGGGLLWGGLAAMAVPVAIHLLTRLRRRPQPWGAMRFLIEAYHRHRSQLRLEQLLLLLVRCLILAVLGAALAGPILTGCARLGASAGGLVCIVLDDSLTTQAAGLNGEQRFDRLRKTAIAIIDALQPSDRIAVWRAARPPEPVQPTASTDHLEVRRRVEALRPRFSRADMVGTLESVNAVVSKRSRPVDRTVVVLLTDWAGDAVEPDRPMPAQLAKLGDRCRLFVARPAPSADNVQVLAVEARRPLLLAESDGSAILAVDMKLRRFGVDRGVAQTQLRVAVHGADGSRLGQVVERSHNWVVGQALATVHVELHLDADTIEAQSAGADRASGEVTLTVEASIGSRRFGDALAADNQRWALIKVRQYLRVAVIDTLQGHAGGDETVYTPHDLISFALQPARPEWGPSAVESRIEKVDLEPANVSDQTVDTLDGALVLRPDRLDGAAWRALRRLADRGGLVWLFMPATDAPAVWTEALANHFDLDWRVGLEPQQVSAHEPDRGWSLAADTPVPAELDLLASDWSSMLRPVRFFRRYPLTVPAGSQQVWIEAQDGRPLLASAAVGTGRVMLLAAAIDERWTNLPKKPLFIPLLHEPLRSIVGAAQSTRRLSQFVCGDPLLLDPPWRGVAAIETDNTRVPVRYSDTGLVSGWPLERPGVYRTVPVSGQRLAVNIDPIAGNTTAMPAGSLEAWLDEMGDWRWLDNQSPAEALARQLSGVALGWPLLWAVLALLLLEMLLSRWFSHARSGAAVSWRSRVSGWVKG